MPINYFFYQQFFENWLNLNSRSWQDSRFKILTMSKRKSILTSYRHVERSVSKVETSPTNEDLRF